MKYSHTYCITNSCENAITIIAHATSHMGLKRNILSNLYQFGRSVTKVGLISKREGIDLPTSIVASKNEIAKKDRNLQIFYDKMEYTHDRRRIYRTGYQWKITRTRTKMIKLNKEFYDSERDVPLFMIRNSKKIHSSLLRNIRKNLSQVKLKRDFLQSQIGYTRQRKAVANVSGRNNYHVFHSNELWENDLITLSSEFRQKSSNKYR